VESDSDRVQGVTIRTLRLRDRLPWLALRQALWPDSSKDELSREQVKILADSKRQGTFVAVGPRGALLGFVEVSLHDYAEGCTTHPVGYLEGWYVKPAGRRAGLGSALLDAAERWARSRGCREFASDSELDNRTSRAAHRALGFDEVGAVMLYKKRLGSERKRGRRR
jgi:aminoglycoside 6'-N-acetyltransferase I